MMFPSLIAPPAVYPTLLRPTPTLTLPQSLQSAFAGHSSFLVEDLIRISRPAAYLPRAAAPTPNNSPPAAAAAATADALAAADMGPPSPAGTRRGCSARAAASPASDATFLKFGVNAILASTPRTGKPRLPRGRSGCVTTPYRGRLVGEEDGPLGHSEGPSKGSAGGCGHHPLEGGAVARAILAPPRCAAPSPEGDWLPSPCR